jgi:putative transposase
MTTRARTRYAGYRFPAEIIGHGVWLYFHFPLGPRMVEELLAARGIIVSRSFGKSRSRPTARRAGAYRRSWCDLRSEAHFAGRTRAQRGGGQVGAVARS